MDPLVYVTAYIERKKEQQNIKKCKNVLKRAENSGSTRRFTGFGVHVRLELA